MSCIDLFDLVGQLSQVTVVLASDGLWDVWAYKDVLKYPLRAAQEAAASNVPLHPPTVETALAGLVEQTRVESADMFGESADNITAICVCFSTIAPA